MRHLSVTDEFEAPPAGSIGAAPADRAPAAAHSDLAELYVRGSGVPRVRPSHSGTPAAASAVAPPLRMEAVLGRHQSSLLAVLLPACVLLTGGGLGAYLWWFMHSIPMACMVGALGLVGGAFCRQLLR